MELYTIACPYGYLRLQQNSSPTVVVKEEQATVFKDYTKAINTAKNTNEIKKGIMKNYRGWKVVPHSIEAEDTSSKEIDIKLDSVESITEQTLYTLKNALAAKQQLVDEKHKIEGAILDIEHYGEFHNCNACEGYKLFRQLSELRRKRRDVKDKLSIIYKIEESGLYNSTVSVKQSLDDLKVREYNPRVLDELFNH